MRGSIGRAVWWVLADVPPRSATEVAALAALPALFGLAAVALAWPWLSAEAPRALAAGTDLVRAALGFLLDQLRAAFPPAG